MFFIRSKHKRSLYNKSLRDLTKTFLYSLLLTVLILATYHEVWNNQFINYDDNLYITGNSFITSGLSLENIKRALTAEVAGNWHPFTLLSHMLDCQLFGLNPGAHHLMNLVFHIINTILLLLILKNIGGEEWQALTVAAVFAIHPLHVESVAWIAERKDLLCGFFFFLTIWAYLHYTKKISICRYIAVILFFLFGLMSKPMIVTLPFLLLVLDFWPLGRFHRSSFDNHVKPKTTADKTVDFIRANLKLIIEKTPLILIVVLSCFITLHYQKSGKAVASLTRFPFHIRFENAFISYIEYLYKTIWPFDLEIFYPYPISIPLWRFFFSLSVFIFITYTAIRQYKRRPWLTMGWFWYAGMLVPVIGLVQVGSQAMADRYTYLPMIGILVAAVWSITRILINDKKFKYISLAVFTAFFFNMSIITWVQVRYWRNSKTVFAHALDVSINNPIANNNLGMYLARHEKPKDAICHFRKALERTPDFAAAHNNLANLLEDQKQYGQARRHYEKAIELSPDFADVYNNLGILYYNQHKIQKAIKYLKKAVQLEPKNYAFLLNLNKVLSTSRKK